MELMLFYAFGGLAVLCAFITISSHKPVNSAIALISTMFCMAGIYALLEAHLIAAFQLIVYAGAIMILFLFVIMLLNLREKEGAGFERHNLFIQIILIVIVAGVFMKGITLSKSGMSGLLPDAVPDFGSVSAVGEILFTRFVFPFEVASLVLLVGIIGAVVLAMGISKR